jgi:hypothetical protein
VRKNMSIIMDFKEINDPENLTSVFEYVQLEPQRFVCCDDETDRLFSFKTLEELKNFVILNFTNGQ